MHESFDEVAVGVYASFNDSFKFRFKFGAGNFDENSEGIAFAFLHIFDVWSDDAYFAVLDFFWLLHQSKFKLLFQVGSTKFYVHIVSSDSFAFIDYPYVNRYILKH